MEGPSSGSSISRGDPGDANQSEADEISMEPIDASALCRITDLTLDTNANDSAAMKKHNDLVQFEDTTKDDGLLGDLPNEADDETQAGAACTTTATLGVESKSYTDFKAAMGRVADSLATTEEDAECDGAGLSSLAKEQTKTPLNELLNDAGQFSYLALCSVNMALLFEDQWNSAWKEKKVQGLVAHMKLPKKMSSTMTVLMTTQRDEEAAAIFARGLRDDPCLPQPRLVPQDLILWSMSNGQYDARSRVLALKVARMMDVTEEEIQEFEASVVTSFIQEKVELSEEEIKEKEKRAKTKKVKRFAMIGAAAVGGGALIGLTGGLAAPLIASAGAALLGSGVAVLGSAAGVAVMASVFGAAGAGLTGFKMKKRVGAVEEFAFESLSDEKDLHVTIAISGWLTNETLTFEDEVYNNFSVPWLTLASSREVYSLRWESKYLLELGEALTLILNKIMTMAAKEALKMTVLAGLVVALALPATAYTSLVAIDNPWSVVTNRAAEAGKQLAEVLLSRQQGKRPVTLIGFSMGARVIFFCLKELASRKGCEGIIQDAVLLGAPVSSSVKSWKSFERVVAGRIINGYCRGDWLLQLLYRTASIQVINIAGLGPVKWEDRRMVNVDLTDTVNGHFDYGEKMEDILKAIGIRTRASRVSESLADLAAGRSDGGQFAGATQVLDDSKVAVIDASDLILEADVASVAGKLDLTGPSETEPVLGRNQTRPVPGYDQTKPVPGHDQTEPVLGCDQTMPVPSCDQTAPDSEDPAKEMLEGMTP